MVNLPAESAPLEGRKDRTKFAVSRVARPVQQQGCRVEVATSIKAQLIKGVYRSKLLGMV